MAFLVALLLASADAFPLEVRVGKSVAICKTGTILCPAGNAICDDDTIVGVEASADGIVFRGRKPGTTLCSAASGSGAGMRSVYKVTVVK
jgi:hypothetical protein